MKIKLTHPVFRKITELATENKKEVYLIGGYVRDLLLKRPVKYNDIDIVIVGDATEFAKQLRVKIGNQTSITVFKNFGTAQIKADDIEIELASARKESYRKLSRKPDVKFSGIEDDFKRRDFTINALAVSLNKADYGKLIDKFNGLDDLKKKIIKTPLDPDITFSDDPLRMLRAIRFAIQLDFELHSETYNAIQKNVNRIEIVSMERISDELNKILAASKPSKGFRLMYEIGLLKKILPELTDLQGVETIEDRSHKDNFFHTLQVVDNVAKRSENLWLRWAALLHDVGKGPTKKYNENFGWTFHGHEVVGSRMVKNIFRRLKMPMNEKMKYVKKLVELHLRPIALANEGVTDSAIRRLIVKADDEIDDLLLLCKADITSKNPVKVRTYLNRFEKVGEKIIEVEAKDRLRNWKPPVTGEMIMKAFNIKPSRMVGTIKNKVQEAILDGEIPNEKKAAYNYMIKTGKELGLKKRINSE